MALAVDDFGSWYSSLATLGDLPVDAVKLDQSFVRGVGSDLDDDTIVASVIRLAHARDLYVVAEGVESWSESARLVDLGCDRAFGYLFSPPQTPERARAMLARGSGWRPSTRRRLARSRARAVPRRSSIEAWRRCGSSRGTGRRTTSSCCPTSTPRSS